MGNDSNRALETVSKIHVTVDRKKPTCYDHCLVKSNLSPTLNLKERGKELSNYSESKVNLR